jgi:DNA-binding CsgD family transcriptional regulator
MLSNFNYEYLLNSLINIQSHLYDKTSVDTNSIKEDYKYINEFAKNANTVKMVFDHAQFKIIHVSDNVEMLSGYSINDAQNILFILKIITDEHVNFMNNWFNWMLSVHSKLGHLHNTKQAICGVKIKHKDGRIKSLMLRYSPLEMNENGVAKTAIISIDDITHLVRGDFYWGRLVQREKNVVTNTHYFVSTDIKDTPHDLLSDREKLVLQLLAEGRESKEIGEILFISSHTVDNHRRNMINKIGVRDTTALLQICKMAGIL